jgi:uncharacterized membrane protein
MRFVLGVIIGFGVGFAGAVLFAQQKSPAKASAPGGGSLGHPVGASANGSRGVLGKVRKGLDEALTEAKQARREAEKDMTERYQRTVGRSK